MHCEIMSAVIQQAKQFNKCLNFARDELSIRTGAGVATTKATAGRIEDKLDGA
jgi:hypothetical protein